MLFFTRLVIVFLWLIKINAVENRTLQILNETESSNRTNATRGRNFCIGFGLDFWRGCAEDTLNSGQGCLSGDGLVQLASGSYKTVAELRAGDRVLAMDEYNPAHIVETDVVMIMHRMSNQYATFYTIETGENQIIRLTPGHFVPVLAENGERRYKQAKTLTVEDHIFVQSVVSNQLIASKIFSIKVESRVGFYSPLTETGTLIVNNVSVSCFSGIFSHEMGQLGMTPIRWIHAIMRYLMPAIKAPFHDDNMEEMHWIPSTMQTLAKALAPQIFTQ